VRGMGGQAKPQQVIKVAPLRQHEQGEHFMASSTENSSKAARSSKSTRSESNVGTAREAKSGSMDAIALLKADHKQVAEWFEQFESARSDEIKQALAQQICAALTVHATIEEEIFYPAFLDATGETDLHHEAEIEHEGAKRLIAEIEESSPEDEYFDARVTVLAEMIRHHVNEEEQRDGMFAKAKESDMDLEALGEQLQARKEEMTDESPPQRRAG
jgi:hemerythrin superfamily protein